MTIWLYQAIKSGLINEFQTGILGSIRHPNPLLWSEDLFRLTNPSCLYTQRPCVPWHTSKNMIQVSMLIVKSTHWAAPPASSSCSGWSFNEPQRIWMALMNSLLLIGKSRSCIHWWIPKVTPISNNSLPSAWPRSSICHACLSVSLTTTSKFPSCLIWVSLRVVDCADLPSTLLPQHRQTTSNYASCLFLVYTQCSLTLDPQPTIPHHCIKHWKRGAAISEYTFWYLCLDVETYLEGSLIIQVSETHSELGPF